MVKMPNNHILINNFRSNSFFFFSFLQTAQHWNRGTMAKRTGTTVKPIIQTSAPIILWILSTWHRKRVLRHFLQLACQTLSTQSAISQVCMCAFQLLMTPFVTSFKDTPFVSGVATQPFDSTISLLLCHRLTVFCSFLLFLFYSSHCAFSSVSTHSIYLLLNLTLWLVTSPNLWCCHRLASQSYLQLADAKLTLSLKINLDKNKNISTK